MKMYTIVNRIKDKAKSIYTDTTKNKYESGSCKKVGSFLYRISEHFVLSISKANFWKRCLFDGSFIHLPYANLSDLQKTNFQGFQ
jgi:hypothetical protein